MNSTRDCGCKSFRSCYKCESQLGLSVAEVAQARVDSEIDKVRTYCPKCKLVYPGWGVSCEELEGHGEYFPGINFLLDFITPEEEDQLLCDLDLLEWDVSQSGRRKQNFGPRANFKKKKSKLGAFAGFPKCTKFIQDQFLTVPQYLDGFRTVEQCSIEYNPNCGSSIDPHIDDCWIWGERIVQLNMISDTVLTFFPYHNVTDRYNVVDAMSYPEVTDPCTREVVFNPFKENANNIDYQPYKFKTQEEIQDWILRVETPDLND